MYQFHVLVLESQLKNFFGSKQPVTHHAQIKDKSKGRP